MKFDFSKLTDEGTSFLVFYFFAGMDRHNDIGHYLREWASTYEDIKLTIEEVDILRAGKSHDLSRANIRDFYKKELRTKKADASIITPPCSGFSRAHYSNEDGPPPGRSSMYPWGFPWNDGALKRMLDLENLLLEFSFEVLEEAARLGSLGLLEHPEDLGAVPR